MLGYYDDYDTKRGFEFVADQTGTGAGCNRVEQCGFGLWHNERTGRLSSWVSAVRMTEERKSTEERTKKFFFFYSSFQTSFCVPTIWL